jgi:hypothetical protein
MKNGSDKRPKAPSLHVDNGMPKEVIYIPTKYGDCEALRRWGDEWIISYPWHTQEFFGSKEAVQAEMNRQIEERYEAETKVPLTTVYIPTGQGDARAFHVSRNRWKIEYPWGEDEFNGDMKGVRNELKRKIVEYYNSKRAAAE